MTRIVILAKAEQMPLFGLVAVRAHDRHTTHGVVHVEAHTAHVQPHAPHQEAKIIVRPTKALPSPEQGERPYKFLGYSDNGTCEHCGREELKRTIAVQDEHGNTVHMGVNCAATQLRRTAKDVRDAVNAAERAKQETEAQARRERWQRETQEWVDFLMSETGGGMVDFGGRPDVFRMIQKLGGMKRARELQDQRRRERGEVVP